MNDNNTKLGDERWASWKFLLPLSYHKRCLLIGDTQWLITALARSYDRVDVITGKDHNLQIGPSDVVFDEIRPITESNLKNANAKYNLIVTHDKAEEKFPASRLARLLEKGGILVVRRTGIKARIAYHSPKDIQGKYYFAALPATAPRLFIPLMPRNFRQKCLLFHQPGSKPAKLTMSLIRAASRLGFTFPLKNHGITIRSMKKPPWQGTPASWLGKRIGCDCINMAVYCGSSSPRRKVTLLAETANQDCLILKISDTVLGAEAIHQEAEALKALAGNSISFEVPKLLLLDRWAGHTIQVQTPVPLDSDQQIQRPTRAHIKIIKALAAIGRELKPLKATSTWKHIETGWIACNPARFHPIMHHIFNYLRTSALEKRVICHRTHGDFAPWNMRSKEGIYYILTGKTVCQTA